MGGGRQAATRCHEVVGAGLRGTLPLLAVQATPRGPCPPPRSFGAQPCPSTRPVWGASLTRRRGPASAGTGCCRAGACRQGGTERCCQRACGGCGTRPPRRRAAWPVGPPPAARTGPNPQAALYAGRCAERRRNGGAHRCQPRAAAHRPLRPGHGADQAAQGGGWGADRTVPGQAAAYPARNAPSSTTAAAAGPAAATDAADSAA